MNTKQHDQFYIGLSVLQAKIQKTWDIL